ncbi:MAG TPA: protein kinase [Candidatus Sulfopaludibacter sp.]|nr:protein kinase [Candidatus Sulfopaludibacter sp.]
MNETTQVLKDRYEIERTLGRGGMSVVFLARDRQLLSKRVVVKVLLEETSEDPWVRQKFLQEMEALARIDHPGVVGVLDTGQTPEGKQFLVMQYIEGETLRSAIQPGGMDLARAAAIVRQISQALAAAHDKGVWHRDLKPENVMLQHSGGDDYAKLIDFGIAGIQDSHFSGEKTKVAGSLTYMAPEQFAGSPCAASDIYALGVVAYELLTGAKPFSSSSMTHLAGEERHRFAPPRQLRPDLPEAAERAILKAMSFRSELRQASARELGEAIFTALTSAGAAAGQTAGFRNAPTELLPTPPPASRRRVGLLVAAAVILVGGASAGGWFLLHPKSPPLELNYSITVQKTRGGAPFGDPFRLASEMIFEQDYEIALNVASPQAGYLYILNYGVDAGTGKHTFNLLEPRNGASARRVAGESVRIPPQQNWFQFDAASGKELLYLVWSAQPVPEVEAVKALPAPHSGVVEIADPTPVAKLQTFLDAHHSQKSRNEQADQTELRATGDLLVYAVPLEHH